MTYNQDHSNRLFELTKAAVVFDLDGTLIDTSEDIVYTINHMRRQAGMQPLCNRMVLNAVGHGASILVQKTLEIDPDDTERLESLVSECRAHFALHQGTRSHPYPGISEMIARLYEFADLYVLSNKPSYEVIHEVDLAGFAHYFREIWGAGSFAQLKPDPGGIYAAMELSGVVAENTIMVGDLPVDMETAIRAGVHAVFVTWGFGSVLDIRDESIVIAENPSNLPELVASILRQ